MASSDRSCLYGPTASRALLAVGGLDLRLVLGEALGWRLRPGGVTRGGRGRRIVRDIGEVGRRGPEAVTGTRPRVVLAVTIDPHQQPPSEAMRSLLVAYRLIGSTLPNLRAMAPSPLQGHSTGRECRVELGDERGLAALALAKVVKVGGEAGRVAGPRVVLAETFQGLDRLGVAVRRTADGDGFVAASAAERQLGELLAELVGPAARPRRPPPASIIPAIAAATARARSEYSRPPRCTDAAGRPAATRRSAALRRSPAHLPRLHPTGVRGRMTSSPSARSGLTF